MIGNVINREVADSIGAVWGDAASAVRQDVNSAFENEWKRGERSRREESYTDRLVGIIRNSVNRSLREMGEKASRRGTSMMVDFDPMQPPVVEEESYGLDIGLRLVLRTPEARMVKGLLVQCKRMYGSGETGTFDEIRGRGETQALKMLEVTPASVFFLFNGGTREQLLEMAFTKKSFLWRYVFGDASMWDLGVAVLPASRVLALSTAAKNLGRPVPVDAPTILRGCMPLGLFIVEFFGSCFVGDPRTAVVRLSTAPKFRKKMFRQVGGTTTDFDAFAVKHFINIEVEITQNDL